MIEQGLRSPRLYSPNSPIPLCSLGHFGQISATLLPFTRYDMVFSLNNTSVLHGHSVSSLQVSSDGQPYDITFQQVMSLVQAAFLQVMSLVRITIRQVMSLVRITIEQVTGLVRITFQQVMSLVRIRFNYSP